MFSRLAKEYIAGNEICSGCFQDVETNNNVQCQRAESFSPQELRIDDKQEENLWQSIVDEYEEKQSQYTEWKKEQESSAVVVPYQDVSSNYLNRKIFPLLLPAMENMLVEARRWDALRVNYTYVYLVISNLKYSIKINCFYKSYLDTKVSI